jgi:membrane protease YdiL (CAAX protease family)
MAFLVWGLSLLLLGLAPVVFLLPYAARRGITPALPDYARALGEFALKDPTAIFLQVFSTLPAHVLTLAVVWAVVTRFGKRPFWETLGWSWSRHLGLWTSAGLGVVLFFASSALAHFLGGDKLTPLEEILNSSPATRYMIAFLATLTAPLVEELVFRGVLYSALRRLIGTVGAVIFIVALFTAVHVPQYRTNYGVIAAVALLSLALTVIRAVSGRLLPCFIVHLVFNGIQSIIIVWQPAGNRPVVTPDHVTALVMWLTRALQLLI